MGKLLIICGATATGKSELAVKCAQKLNSEIISADSQLVYKKLNIGTAKPTKDEMCGIKHHMIDVIEPTENYSVSDYRIDAKAIVDNLLSEGKTPVICGGTGFYINSVLYDLSYGKSAANFDVRSKYETLLKEKGNAYLHNLLKSIDSDTADKLHVNDTKRIIRALEIYETSGIKKSEFKDDYKPLYDYLAVAVDYPREELYKRIDMRVDKMFEAGLVDEVINLLNNGVDEYSQCMQAIGYKEVVQGLKNKLLESTMRDIIKQNTRHYAKRQITFFKKLKNIVWIEPENATAEYVLEMLNG